jgi:hypothetical protein
MGDIVKVVDLPKEIKSALKRLGYRKRKAILTICTGVEIYSTQWDGGSRNEWYGVDCVPIHDPRPWPENMGSMGVRELTKDCPMVLALGTFCGKAATAKIYIHPRFAQSLGMATIGAINV